MSNIHIWPQENRIQDDELIASAIFDLEDGKPQELWYRLPRVYQSNITHSCDPYVIGLLLPAMRAKADMEVHGQVSPSLLNNLEKYQTIWAAWKPNIYQKIEIRADIEEELSKPRTDKAILAFSGGVDSCFSAIRHRAGLAGRGERNLKAGLYIHGFDIGLRRADDYKRAVIRVRAILDSLDMQLIPLATNLKKVGLDWTDEHGIALASCLSLFQNEYTTGIIAATSSYRKLILPWGSNPFTDEMTSSHNFEIAHDGAEFERNEKVRYFAGWPAILENLRVCLVGEHKDRNCCQCEKCIRTILSFRVWGLGLPPCFEHDVSDRQIRRTRYPMQFRIEDYGEILATAQQRSIDASWVSALGFSLRINKIAYKLMQYPRILQVKRALNL